MTIKSMLSGGMIAVFDRKDKMTPAIPMADNDPQRSTYSYAVTGLVLAANATDIVQIRGADTVRTVIRQVICSGSAQNALNIPLQLVHRSAASTGASSTPVWHKRDSLDPNPASTLTVFTGAPSVGAALGANNGIAEAGRLNLAPANNGAVDRWINQYSWQNEKGIVLNSASEYLSLFIPGGNLNIANSPVLDISIIITEELI